MKAVKDKNDLQKIVDSWFASSKNLWKLIDCGMSSTVKIGLGYGIQSNAEVLGYEEEMSRGIFVLRETDAGYYDIPLYSRFKQVEYKGVPHPLSGDYTPREQEDIDDSLYEYGKYGPQPQSPSPTVSDASSIVFSICPSNDSDGELGAVSNHSVNDDPIHDPIPIPSIEQVTIATQKTQPQVPKPKQTVDPSCAQHVKTPRQPIRTPVTPSPIPSNYRQNWNPQMERELGTGYSFERKPCFVCGSLSHLIKNCDYYEKKIAREAALKSRRMVHANVRQATPAWTNTNRVNKANQFTPRPVQLSNIRPNLSTASKTIKTGRVNVNTGHGKVNSGSVHVNSGSQFKSGASKFNTGKQHVSSARVNRPVSSNQTSQVNLKSPKKCFSNQRSPVNRPFSRNTAYKLHKYAVKGKMGTAVKTSAGCVWRKTTPLSNTNSGPTLDSNVNDHPLKHMEHRGIFDSGCSGHMTGNRAHLEDYQELSKVGSVTFGGSKGSISGKGTIRLGNLVFDDVAFVKELGHFNLFSISQICDKKLNVLFTEKECFVVSSDFKMPDENQVLLKVPRQHNMYTFDMKNVDSSKGYTCLLAKASSNEAKLWHRRLGHLNFKNLNKLVKGNLVRGLPSKSFKNDHTCVACQKGKQHKASCKAKIDRYVTHPLHTLHMDLFGPTSVRSINHASYCLVITDDCSRFCWVFFLAKKDETSDILKTFIRQIENQLNQKVKIIRSDNGTEFKNRVMLEFCGEKGIKQEFSNARTPQQNGVAERMNRTLIEAARTMLADSHLPTTFWAEAVNTACYTFNRVRVTKPQTRLESKSKYLWNKELSETKQILELNLQLIEIVKKARKQVEEKRKKPDSAQVNTAQVNTAELNPDSTPSAQINTGEVNAAEVNTGEVNAAEVNTGEVNAAEVNTGEAERAQRRKGKEPMTEEDLQAEVQASKTSKELQELADLEEAKRVQAEMDVETQRQIDLDALLARRLVEQEEEAAREALATEFDYIQARLNADQILAEKIQQEEREQYSVEERAKFLHDTIAAQRKFLAEQRKASELKSLSHLRRYQVLYENTKKQDQYFCGIGSEEDERAIKKMNEKMLIKRRKEGESVHDEDAQSKKEAKKRKLAQGGS
ncbi:putative ribonuclease H-like domain-containing protein [Tanacetum coccineum]